MDLAHALEAPAAGTVAGVLGALGFRAEKGQMLDGAIAALLTGEQGLFDHVFRCLDQEEAKRPFLGPPAYPLE
jgi:hypothetical protein